MKNPIHPLRPLLVALAAALLSLPAGAATFTVNHSGDAADATPGDGDCATAGAVCTLRAAIEEANALAGVDNIHFNIGGGGAVTLSKTGDLPDITSVVHIDGTTQPGASANSLATGSNAVLLVRYDGSASTGNGFNFTTGSGGSSLRGLILSGHSASAILVHYSAGSTFAGNFIGTDASGADLHNNNGIFMLDDADNHTIGGPNPADRNVIANNLTTGITVGNATSLGNILRNNYIGTAPDGVTARRNGLYGIFINSAPGSIVRDNVITSENAAIIVSNGGSNQSSILGNSIGVGADGVANLGGYRGIHVTSGNSGAPQMATIGGVAAGEGNVIANMSGAGIFVDRASLAHQYPTNVHIRGNSIHDNGGMGIDLADSATSTGVGAPNANDANDADSGANYFQNFPVPTSATTDGGTTTVALTYGSYAVGNFSVDVYSSPSCDGNGHGEGRVFLGTASIATDGDGQASVTIPGLPATTVGHFITLTATDTLILSTSEFSTCRAIVAAGAATAHPVPVFGTLGQVLASLILGLGGLFLRRGR